jgi:O-antigen ligase
MNNKIQEANESNGTFDDNDNVQLYYGSESDNCPAGGRMVFIVAAMFLASHFYAIPFIKTPFRYTTYMRLDDIMAVVLFLAVVFGAKNNYPALKTKAGKLLRLVIIGACSLSIVTAFFLGGSLRSHEYAVWQTARYIDYIVVFFLASRVIYTPKRLIVLMWVIFFGGVFVAVYGLAQYYGYISVYYLAELFKESGPWGELAEYGYYKEVLGPLSANHAYCGNMLGTVLAFTWALFSGRTIFSKLVLLSGGAVMLFALILTQARAPLYALPVAIMVNMVFLKGRFRSMLLLVLAALLFYFAARQIPAIRERFLLQESFTYSSGGARVLGWGLMLKWFIAHPLVWLIGVGIGNWQLVVSPDIPGFVAAHNNYIHFLIEGGIFGFTLFLISLGMAIKYTYQLSRCPTPDISKWGQAIFTGVIFLAVSALSQENFVPSPSFGSFLSLFMFLMGATSWAKQYVDEKSSLLTEYSFQEMEISSGERV